VHARSAGAPPPAAAEAPAPARAARPDPFAPMLDAERGMPELDFANLRVFGNTAFRPQQREVIQAVMQVPAGVPVHPTPTLNPAPPSACLAARPSGRSSARSSRPSCRCWPAHLYTLHPP